MEAWIIQMIAQFGYLAVFLLIAAENIFPPLPSEIILAFAGFATSASALSPVMMIFSSTMGSYVGALLLYYLGYKLKKEHLISFLERFHVKRENVEKTIKWFNDKGSFSVFFGRFVPIIRSLISIPAGIVHMKHLPFACYTLLGSLIWNTVLIYAGILLDEHYAQITAYIKSYGIILAVFLAIAAVIVYRIKKKKHTALIQKG